MSFGSDFVSCFQNSIQGNDKNQCIPLTSPMLSLTSQKLNEGGRESRLAFIDGKTSLARGAFSLIYFPSDFSNQVCNLIALVC